MLTATISIFTTSYYMEVQLLLVWSDLRDSAVTYCTHKSRSLS